jgi:hypothetical protein
MLSAPAEITPADVLYGIDKAVEQAILDWIERNWPEDQPVELIMEGIEPIVLPSRSQNIDPPFKLILDPIDGTRCLMFDKRPAWILSGLALNRGPETTLEDIFLAAMTELPISKQGFADQVSGIKGQGPNGIRGTRLNLFTETTSSITFEPYTGDQLEHAFSGFVQILPEGKAVLAETEERLWKEMGLWNAERPVIFSDQYLATGGQLYELLCGKERFLADLRDSVLKAMGISNGLSCHPYDICTALILTESGIQITSPEGNPLNTPLNTTSHLSWIAYTSEALRKRIEPTLRPLIQKMLQEISINPTQNQPIKAHSSTAHGY